ncbi:MAG TPA: metal-dependent hydrolase [Terriglobia bacterium]|nr:metal-dependent hydrolase [Terriglobia bacterium]
MPDGRTHKAIGAGAGMAFALYRAKDQNGQNSLAEVAGGAAGGYIGGLLPDILEPAVSSWHRDVAHSWAAGGAIISLNNWLSAWETACRENAEKCRAIPMVARGAGFVPVTVDPLAQFLSTIAELFWRFLAGLLNGLVAGYVSHLALDAATPRSIPLLTAGF